MSEFLVILDIDETLIHATARPLKRDYDFQTSWYFVYKRPHVHEFIEFCLKHFKVAVWTSAGDGFAEVVIKELFPIDSKLEFVWSYERCTPTLDLGSFGIIHLKNLNKVKRQGYQLERVIMIDDTPEKLAKNYGNLVQVTEYRGQVHDNELLKLMQYLLHLKNVEDIRTVEKRGWQNKFHV